MSGLDEPDVWALDPGTIGMNTVWRGQIRRNSEEFVDGKGGEKLDPLNTKQIHGSKPTKSQHTNKSQKNWGYFWWGIIELGRKTTKQG